MPLEHNPEEKISAVREKLLKDIASVDMKKMPRPQLKAMERELDALSRDISKIQERVRRRIEKTDTRWPHNFLGQVHLSGIELDVILTLDSKTGEIKKIETTRNGAPHELKRNQLQQKISASEYVKEMFRIHWIDDETALANLSSGIETSILKHGLIRENNGTASRVLTLTREQVPAARAHVSPGSLLQPAYEKKRKEIAAARRRELRKENRSV